jgi:hypothetical protein
LLCEDNYGTHAAGAVGRGPTQALSSYTTYCFHLFHIQGALKPGGFHLGRKAVGEALVLTRLVAGRVAARRAKETTVACRQGVREVQRKDKQDQVCLHPNLLGVFSAHALSTRFQLHDWCHVEHTIPTLLWTRKYVSAFG